MKNIWVLLFILCGITSYSQGLKYKYPKIVSDGKSKTEFIPSGWIIRDSVEGDFNKDSLKDLALIIQSKKAFVFNDTICFSTEPYYPKALIILFALSDKSLHVSIIATKIFGNCNWGVQGLDPFDKIEARRGTLGVNFLTGGTSRNYLSYYFRFQNNDWYLIGADSYQYWAGHTVGKDAFYCENINFVTGIKESFNEDENHKQNSNKKTRLSKQRLIKLSDFDDNTIIPFSQD